MKCVMLMILDLCLDTLLGGAICHVQETVTINNCRYYGKIIMIILMPSDDGAKILHDFEIPQCEVPKQYSDEINVL